MRAEGRSLGRKRVAKPMRGAGLAGVSRRRGTRTTRRDAEARPAPDLVERDFKAERPDQPWVADITCIPTWTGFLYLAVVLDAFGRRVVGRARADHLRADHLRADHLRADHLRADHLRADLVLAALDMAIGRRRPDGVIHHSDQGSQCTSVAFGKRCAEAGVRPSMGSVGNAMAESFFATLECELLDRRRFRSQAEARMAVFSCIEGWHNPSRRHSALGYLSPVSYEEQARTEP